jgi:hypothetical protein
VLPLDVLGGPCAGASRHLHRLDRQLDGSKAAVRYPTMSRARTFVVDLSRKQLATATVVTIYRVLAMILRSTS